MAWQEELATYPDGLGWKTPIPGASGLSTPLPPPAPKPKAQPKAAPPPPQPAAVDTPAGAGGIGDTVEIDLSLIHISEPTRPY